MAPCNYSNGGSKGRDRRARGSRASEAQLRLQKLEEMVTSLMQTTKEGLEGRSENTAPNNVTVD